MERVDVTAVVGACAPERGAYARRIADETGAMLIPASRLEWGADPAFEAAGLVRWSDSPAGAVVEFPALSSAVEIIGALTDPAAAARLVGIVCVVDAMHLLDDLADDEFLPTERDALGRVVMCVPRAGITVMQLEYASTIMLVNWDSLPTPELSAVMALVSHLSPRARLRLHRAGVDGLPPGGQAYGPGQDRAGWIGVLNGDVDPHMTDRRVSGFRYEQLRPLHPERLQQVLDHRVETGEFGLVVRSAGFCHFATRPRMTLQWDHVMSTIAFHLVSVDDRVSVTDEVLAVGQDLAFIGLDLDHAALATALDGAALTDEELAAGPAAWQRFADPFPSWSPAGGHAG